MNKQAKEKANQHWEESLNIYGVSLFEEENLTSIFSGCLNVYDKARDEEIKKAIDEITEICGSCYYMTELKQKLGIK